MMRPNEREAELLRRLWPDLAPDDAMRRLIMVRMHDADLVGLSLADAVARTLAERIEQEREAQAIENMTPHQRTLSCQRLWEFSFDKAKAQAGVIFPLSMHGPSKLSRRG